MMGADLFDSFRRDGAEGRLEQTVATKPELNDRFNLVDARLSF